MQFHETMLFNIDPLYVKGVLGAPKLSPPRSTMSLTPSKNLNWRVFFWNFEKLEIESSKMYKK